MTYTLLATSGWQGDGWRVIGRFTTLLAAREAREAAATPDPRSLGYITRIVRGEGRPCDRHECCDVFRLSGRGPGHLVGRNVHVREG
jgi:hypothetical protein